MVSLADAGRLVAGEPWGELVGLIGREKLTESRLRALFGSSAVLRAGRGGRSCEDLRAASAPEPRSRLAPRPCGFGGGESSRCGGSTEAGLRTDLAGIWGGNEGTGGASASGGTASDGRLGEGVRKVRSVIDPLLSRLCSALDGLAAPTDETEPRRAIRFVWTSAGFVGGGV